MRSLLMYAPSNNGTGDGEKSNLHAKIKNIFFMTKNSLGFFYTEQKKSPEGICFGTLYVDMGGYSGYSSVTAS
jgi:hypothetical protein